MKKFSSFRSFALLYPLLFLSPACGGQSTESDMDGVGGSSENTGGKGAGADENGGSDSGGSDSGGTASGSGGDEATTGGAENASGGAENGGSGGAEGGTGSDGGGGAASGGAGAGGDGAGGDGAGGGSGCEPYRMAPHNARSASFSGSDEEYSELYDLACTEASDCVAPCEDLGGTEWFCEAHICIDSEPDYCLPPTKWRGVTQALVPGSSTNDSAVTSLGTSNGAMQDRLILEDFDFNIPDEATIVGIEVEVRRAAEGGDTTVIDYAVQLVKAGVEVGSNHGTTDPWGSELESVFYGGQDELWGESWTPADVNDPGFGVAIGALPNGSGRAYIDIAYISVYTDCP